jgi:outer membrane autotransporter protein
VGVAVAAACLVSSTAAFADDQITLEVIRERVALGVARIVTALAVPALNGSMIKAQAQQLLDQLGGETIQMKEHGQSASAANGVGNACDAACDEARRWGAWVSGLGGFGTVAGDASNSPSSYNLAGLTAGLDYAFDPRLTAGVTIGYSSSTSWTTDTPGQSTTDQGQIGLYGRYREGAFSLGGLAGYGRAQSRLTQSILLPGVAPMTALGSTTANQFFGFVQTGYRIDINTGANAHLTPFARLQGSTTTQAAYNETGVGPLDLTIAAQTMNSLASVLGTQVGWSIGSTDVNLQVGWSHEFGDTSIPSTVSFVGAPAATFNSQSVATPRDGAVLGLGVSTRIADQAKLYARYDGQLNGGTTSHIISAGLRITW